MIESIFNILYGFKQIRITCLCPALIPRYIRGQYISPFEERLCEVSSVRAYATVLLMLIIAVVVSCGGGDPDILATGEGFSITLDDFRDEFEILTPEGQVMVLEEGGRLDLVIRMVNRSLLLREAQISPPEDLDVWLRLSETAWLSNMWIEFRLDSLNEEGIDSVLVDSLLHIGISLEAVLMEDSSEAALLLRDWREMGSYDPGEGMILAPWSLDGSSYIQIDGNMFSFLAGDPSFAAVTLPLIGEGYVQVPAFGAWVVCRIDTTHLEHGGFTLQSVSRQYVTALLGEESVVTVFSKPVQDLAEHLAISGGIYEVRDIEGLDRSTRIAVYPGGEISTGEVIEIFQLMRPENFFGSIPQELYPLAPPIPTIEPGIDLWMFVGNLATVHSQAERAIESEMGFPEDQIELTTTEHMLRVVALQPAASVDSLTAIAYYEANSEYYILPELRSVLLAYIPTEWLSGSKPYGFDDIGQYYSRTDSLGVMLPTPPRAIEVFGPIGPAVFAADQGSFEGPVQVGNDDLYAYFEVVEIIPEGSTGPEEILPLLMNDCRLDIISSSLEEYFMELWSHSDVEIDSTAVDQIDPWATVY